MRNRAKCKKCESIIESTSLGDIVYCKCGEISVSGGDKLGCAAKDWNSFLRVDDEGNVIVPTIQEAPKPTKEDFIKALDEMIKSIEAMPPNAMVISINHYDFLSLLVLLQSIFSFDESKPTSLASL